MVFFLLVYSALTTLAFGQYSEQPSKESSTDLRSQTVLFSIELPEDKKSYVLERTTGSDYFLRLRVKKEETIRKVAGREAIKMDQEFASKFLKVQYEIPSKEGKCEVTLRLTMKGEEQEICEKDDKKSQEFTAFIEHLSKRF